ncbi:MAG: YigZ family protein [Clostridia bacterium]
MAPQESNRDYHTVRHPASFEMLEKKSRFIASVRPVTSHEEADLHIRTVSLGHREASHNTYAYICREGNSLYQKHSDDGEPQGTGGLPVLEAIRAKDLCNVCVVVTRYFGGTLLGKGGLTRAYGKCASTGLEKAGRMKRTFCKVFSVQTEYAPSKKILDYVESHGYNRLDVEYTDNVRITVGVPDGESGSFVEKTRDLTHGQADIRREREQYMETED